MDLLRKYLNVTFKGPVHPVSEPPILPPKIDRARAAAPPIGF